MNNGYTIPEGTELGIILPSKNDNPNMVDLDVLISLNNNMDQQLKDLQLILASKFGQSVAEEVTKYARNKQVSTDILNKSWVVNNQHIRVASSYGNWTISIIVWLPGVE